MTPRSLLNSIAAVMGAALLVPSLAFAQPAPPTSAGPMTVEHLHSGFYGGGDVKITDFNHHTSELVGGQGGWVIDDAFFIGGAGYWLVNGGHDDELGYGGLVLQWMFPVTSRVTFGAKALIGGGEATTSQTATVAYYPTASPKGIQNPNDRNAATALRPTTYRYNETFFVFEPEATAAVRIAGRVHLTGGISYRLTSSYYDYYYYSDSHLGGLTGTIGFKIF